MENAEKDVEKVKQDAETTQQAENDFNERQKEANESVSSLYQTLLHWKNNEKYTGQDFSKYKKSPIDGVVQANL